MLLIMLTSFLIFDDYGRLDLAYDDGENITNFITTYLTCKAVDLLTRTSRARGLSPFYLVRL